MYIAIVDDQLPEIKRIELLLKKEFESQQIMIEIDYFTSGKDFAGEWNPGKYDMVILDIYMEEMTGIEVGQFIRQRDDNAKIVFYTSSNEFASESYNLNASYYLLKPATPVQLHNMFLRCFPELGEQKRIMILPDGQKIIPHSIHRDCSWRCRRGRSRRSWGCPAAHRWHPDPSEAAGSRR